MKRLFLLLLILMFLTLGCSRTINCGDNIECFKNSAQECSKAKFLFKNDGNDVLVTLRGVSNEKCGVSFKIMEISQEIKDKYSAESAGLKGRTLNCLVPIKYKEGNNWLELINVSEKLDEYCSGQIKELAKGPLKEVLKNEFNKLLEKQ